MSDANLKLCECGCGRPTPLATYTNSRLGYLRGTQIRFIHGHNKANFRHGFGYQNPEYTAWMNMKQRCDGKTGKERDKKNYAGRGIHICERWKSFNNFYADMGPRPPGMTLDRINNDGNYEPGNCRWTTRSVQNKNRRPWRRSS